MSLFNKIFGDANQKYLKSIQPLVDRINELEEETKKLSDSDFKTKTKEFKERLGKGETLDDILPEAFALVREAAFRTLEQRHYDVQLIGGIIMHQGKISEMRTGEGKTLSVTLPVYLNALTGKGVHLITVNDYLSKRDAAWMGQVYHFLGLTIGSIAHDSSFIYSPEHAEQLDKERDEKGGFKVFEDFLKPVSRKEAYLTDITYGTNNEFGFDYLRDNLAYSLDQQSQRGHYFAVVDEIDSILIDESRTPLIISAPDQDPGKMYSEFAGIIPKLDKEKDYEIDEKLKTVVLTEEGVDKLEKILGVENIYEDKGIKYLRHLEQSLKANFLFKKDRDYVVRNNEILIVDEFTGRILPGRRYSGGLHQSLEAKEGVRIQPESITLASVTYQNYFRMYEKLSGMTGTAATSSEEFDKVYKLDVIVVPTNKDIQRKDLPDKIYKSEKGKYQAILKEIKERHEKGQPVLVGTVSIEKNEYLGKLLEREGVPHNILNAKQHEREGEIIAQAGKLGAVTIATNMAGRGVDIILGGNPGSKEDAEKVKSLGGLCVIGTSRHEARRIDNQLRGRAGRQGDPGSSQFFISLEDDLMRVFGGDRIKKMMDTLRLPEDQPIEAGMVSSSIEKSQSKVEGMYFDTRKHLLDYDDVINKHREKVYAFRKEILALSEKPFSEGLEKKLFEIAEKHGFEKKELEDKKAKNGEENFANLVKVVFLKTIDHHWMNHIDEMDYLKESVRLRAYGQKDPLIEYKSEGHRAFKDLIATIEGKSVDSILKVDLVKKEEAKPAIKLGGNDVEKTEAGRNDDCPCGSGKKYKKCCMNK
jgi:preprotein translocase subunit SecA